MILLLDTHALVWALEDSPRLSPRAREAIEDPGNTVLASVVSAWEIAIKQAMGRIDAPGDLAEAIEAVGFVRRVVDFADVERLASLAPHHRDPFDRMLVAQAMKDGVPIVSCDRQIAQYPIQVVW